MTVVEKPVTGVSSPVNRQRCGKLELLSVSKKPPHGQRWLPILNVALGRRGELG